MDVNKKSLCRGMMEPYRVVVRGATTRSIAVLATTTTPTGTVTALVSIVV